jgi:DNA-nicking Smr family endonuclease
MPKRKPAGPPGTHRPFEALKAKRAAAGPARARVHPTVEARKEPADEARKRHVEALELAASLRDVVPLSTHKQRVPRTVAVSARSARPSASATRGDRGEAEHDTETPAPESADVGFELVDDGHLLEGRRLDVDPRELGKLRRERYPIDGSLDLHGHTLATAREAVAAFVERRRMQGDRVVLLIHGKGRHSPRGSRVLRGELGAWLSQSSAARHVRAFASLDESPEPSGAVLVLLARR